MNTLYFPLHCIYSTALEASYFSDFTYNKPKKYDALQNNKRVDPNSFGFQPLQMSELLAEWFFPLTAQMVSFK